MERLTSCTNMNSCLKIANFIPKALRTKGKVLLNLAEGIAIKPFSLLLQHIIVNNGLSVVFVLWFEYNEGFWHSAKEAELPRRNSVITII